MTSASLRRPALLVALGLVLQVPAVVHTTPMTFLILALAAVPITLVGVGLAVREIWLRGPQDPDMNK